MNNQKTNIWSWGRLWKKKYIVQYSSFFLFQSPAQQQHTWMTSDFGTSSHFDTVYVPASHQERVLSSELPLLEFDMMPPGDVMIESSLSKLVN